MNYEQKLQDFLKENENAKQQNFSIKDLFNLIVTREDIEKENVCENTLKSRFREFLKEYEDVTLIMNGNAYRVFLKKGMHWRVNFKKRKKSFIF